MLKQGTLFTKSQFSLTIILLTKAQQFKIKITNKVNNFMPQLFFAPPYQPCHILHGKSVVTYRHSALLQLAELSIASSMGPKKTIPITDIILRRNDWAKIYCTKGEMTKLAPCQASSAQRYKEYN
jgi:hypothetical protein